jgi:hypothetical protein
MRSHLIVFNIVVAFASNNDYAKAEASAVTTQLTQELSLQQKAVKINVDPVSSF